MKKLFCLLICALLAVSSACPAFAADAVRSDDGSWQVPYRMYDEEFSTFISWKDASKDEKTMYRVAALLLMDVDAGLDRKVFDPDKVIAYYMADMSGLTMLIAYTGTQYFWISPFSSYININIGNFNGSVGTIDSFHSYMQKEGIFGQVRRLDAATLAGAMAVKPRTAAEVLAEDGYEAVFRSAGKVYAPECGWTAFLKGDVAGFVSPGGEYLTDGWNYVRPFEEDTGLAFVYRGEVEVSPTFIYPKWDSRTREYLGKCGLINTRGEYVVPVEYGNIEYMGEGCYTLKGPEGRTILNTADGSMIRMDGYDYFYGICSDGMICVYRGELNEYGSPKGNGFYGMIDLNGGEVFPLEYEYLGSAWYDGMITVKKNGKYGLMDRSGRVTAPCTWDSIDRVSDGTAIAKRDDSAYLIDASNGQILYAFGTKYAGKVGEWYYYCQDFENHMGLLDASFNEVMAPEWYDIARIRDCEGMLRVGKKGEDGTARFGVWDMAEGKFVVRPVYETFDTLPGDGLIRVEQLDFWGYMDTNFRIVIPSAYEDATEFSEGFAAVKNDGRWEIIDTSGATVY